MKKKLISNTYLRGVSEHTLKIIYSHPDCYISVKEIIKIDEPFIIDNYLLLDNNYYIVEIVPKKENYALRIFLNEKKEIVEYYFDITKHNGIDEISNVPYFDDLYTDITIKKGIVNVIDEDELIDAFNNNLITKEDVELANITRDMLLEEIKNNTNKYMNLDIKKYL